ncbi:YaaA family protein [Helicobacter kayseriensis]|uniref:YaaA family protein n=1 Tax=Helicobacter kayseriensis TaxID=2905877 RepID=UPI001E6394DC|nr:YaaA family protein [Helicobacter kayseriensis]MCE3046697.1 YaaA family protein [Helicobacter kayseriensis]MCE3048001.1 YaaA family protein [Helicobacter kayseriensis]
MKILFSPSEGKVYTSSQSPLANRVKIIHQAYLDFVQNAEVGELQKIWGLKKLEEIQKVRQQSMHYGVLPAIECYSGVAYEALGFSSLDCEARKVILDSVVIFSNLFGPISAKENLPFYKLKQGEGFAHFKTKTLYQELEKELDEMLQGECIIDLRAEFYQKLYVPKSHYFTFEFLKNGKRVSHYAKYYRGVALREIAKNGGIYKIEEHLEGLHFLGSEDKMNCTKLVFAI